MIRKSRPALLLASILLFLILNSLLENDRRGELLLLIPLFIVLTMATLELSAKTHLYRPAVLLATLSMSLVAIGRIYPTQFLSIAYWTLLALFLGFVSVGLFSYLGKTGTAGTDRILVSVSLYLLIGIFWFTLYKLLDSLRPGSFVASGSPQNLPPGSLMYLSFITLTTLGYGDIVPVTPLARIIAALEAVAGVLYIAITVARLVSSYEHKEEQNS
jgi:hypothetical protein